MRAKNVEFKEVKNCIVEDLVHSLESHITELIHSNQLSYSTVCASLPQIMNESPFPRACSGCGKGFYSREDYYRHTNIRKRSEDELGHVIEHRSCSCGQLLISLAECLRDNHNFGIACRTYFDVSVERLVREHQLPRSEAKELVRAIFQGVFDGFQYST